jgi:hypothetical protein
VCYGSSVWKFLHVTILATRILSWLVDVWKICDRQYKGNRFCFQDNTVCAYYIRCLLQVLAKKCLVFSRKHTNEREFSFVLNVRLHDPVNAGYCCGRRTAATFRHSLNALSFLSRHLITYAVDNSCSIKQAAKRRSEATFCKFVFRWSDWAPFRMKRLIFCSQIDIFTGSLLVLYFHAVLNNASLSGACSVLCRLKVHRACEVQNTALSKDVTDVCVSPVTCYSCCCFEEMFNTKL